MAKPVYALVGGDSFLQTQKLAAILRELSSDSQKIDSDGETAELSDVLNELRSFAMFGGGKIVVIRNADAFVSRFREQLEDYLASPSTSATLVLRLASLPKNQRIYKLIQKVGQIEECEPPKDLVRWIVSQAKSAHKIDVAADVAQTLAELIGGDLGRLDNELAKLAIQTDKSGKITAKQIAGTIAFQREQEMWEMTNELAAGQTANALKRWRQLIETDPSTEFRAVTWLGMWLEDVGTVLASKRGAGPGVGKLAWKYKDKLNQFMKTAENLGSAGHARALDSLAEIDRQSKSGVGEAATNVERFIVSLKPVLSK